MPIDSAFAAKHDVTGLENMDSQALDDFLWNEFELICSKVPIPDVPDIDHWRAGLNIVRSAKLGAKRSSLQVYLSCLDPLTDRCVRPPFRSAVDDQSVLMARKTESYEPFAVELTRGFLK